MPRKPLLALVLGLLLSPAAVFAQNTIVQGQVRSNAQSPIPGAFVAIPSLTLTTVANASGEYKFVIPADRVTGQEVTIEARSIGHANNTAKVTLRPGTITQNLTLDVKAVQLDEIVVSGTAGRQERRAQSAAVATIDAENIVQNAPITNVTQLLQARTPGMSIRNNSGTTGTAATIRIRGASSITLSNDPLVYIDGIRVTGGSQQTYGVGNQSGTRLNDVKMEDVQSIDVVKGPAAATLYGSDAAAGVINIITKKGHAGSGFVQTLNTEYGESTVNFTPPENYGLCDAASIANTAAFPACTGKTAGTVLHDNPLIRTGSFKNGDYRNLNYSLSGGGEGYDAYFSMGGNRDNGSVPTNVYGQTNTRASFGYAVRDNLHMDMGFGLIRVQTNLPQNDNDIYGYLGGGMLGDPRTIGAKKDGWYAQRQLIATNAYLTEDETTRFQPRASVNFTPTSWLSNRLTVGADMARSFSMQFQAKNDQGWWDNAPSNTGQVADARRAEDRYTLDYLGTVRRDLMQDVRLDLSVGSQVQSHSSDLTNVTGQGLVNNEVRSVNAAATLLNGGQTSSADRQIGVFTQADVSWKERLYLQLGVRRDQSSTFGADSKPFFSPKVGLSYVLSDESFFRNLIDALPDRAITELRLRGAYGVSGRQPTSGARSTYSPSTNLLSTGALAVGVRPGNTGNPLIRPEKSQEAELGFDAGFLNDRLSAEFTYFHKKGIDQILSLPVPGSVGANGPSVNVGALLNSGIELASNARLLTTDNITLEMRGSVATLHNKLLDLGGVPPSPTRKVGFPLNGNWDYVIDSISVPNNTVYVSDSLKFIGNGANYPGWTSTLSSTLTLFRNLSFYAQIDGNGDRVVFDGTAEFRDRQFGQSDVAVLGAAAYGTKADGVTPTDEAVIKYMRHFGPFVDSSGVAVSRGIVGGDYNQSGKFFKLREASVNYILPGNFVSKYVRAKSASVGLTMKNVHTFSSFSGLDPESDQFLTVPPDRRWTARFQLTF